MTEMSEGKATAGDRLVEVGWPHAHEGYVEHWDIAVGERVSIHGIIGTVISGSTTEVILSPVAGILHELPLQPGDAVGPENNLLAVIKADPEAKVIPPRRKARGAAGMFRAVGWLSIAIGTLLAGVFGTISLVESSLELAILQLIYGAAAIVSGIAWFGMAEALDALNKIAHNTSVVATKARIRK